MPIAKSLSVLGFIIFCGWLGRRLKILGDQDTKVISSFVYNFSLPALFLSEILRTDFRTIEPAYFAGTMLPVGIVFAALVVLRWLRVLNKDTFVLYGLSVVFGSYAFFGVPFFESLYGTWGLDLAVLTGSVLSVFGIVATVSLFEYATQSHRGVMFILRVIKSPLIVSVLSGLVLSFLKPYSLSVADIVSPLGKTAPATAIFVLGMFVYDHFSLKMVRKGFALSLFRVIGLPVVTMSVLFFLNSPDVRLNRFLLMQAGIPAAISTAIFADRYQYKKTELTGMVVLTSLAGFVVLGVLYFISLRVY